MERKKNLIRSISVPVKRSKPENKSWFSNRMLVTLGLLATLAAGAYEVGTIDGAVNSATAAVTAEMPNFHGQSAKTFLAKSPQAREAIRNGSLVEVFVDDIPFKKSILPLPNSYSNIAEIITPKDGDMNVVANALINNQSPNEAIVDKTIVTPGQEFIVPATAGAIELANAEAKQGIYTSGQ